MSVVVDGGDVLLDQDRSLVSHMVEEDVLGQGSRLSGADRRRNERLARLRGLAPLGHAILAVDLADEKQHAVLCDHDSQVLARWAPRAKAWQLGVLLDRAVAVAAKRGFVSVTLACEPTGHRWQILAQMAAERGLAMVCVQPLAMRRARESEDYTTGKTDAKDAVVIARLAAKLHCYQPEQLQESWAALRDAGARRARLIVEQTAQRAQIRDLLECVWPAGLAAAPSTLFDSPTWLACLHVVTSRANGRPERLRRGGVESFTSGVRRCLRRFGGTNVQHKIVAAMFAALSDTTGVSARRAGALERVGWVLDDLIDTRGRLARAQNRMVAILDQLGLTDLVCSIPGLSAIGAAAILAETGDPARFSHARALVKHAGLAPRQRASGEHVGAARVTGRGRPRLRLAAWRAVFGALPHNPALRERHHHLTSRTHNPLTDGQARASLAGALLRWLHAICTRRVPFNADLAAGRRPEQTPMAA